MELPSFNKSCAIAFQSGEEDSGYVDYGSDGLPVWFDYDGCEFPDQSVVFWKYVCRDCDGTGLFYQMEDCKCHCTLTEEEMYKLLK